MEAASYEARRGQIEDYFDRTALKAWEQLTSTAPVGRIRATVRAGRDRMRSTLLAYLPLRFFARFNIVKADGIVRAVSLLQFCFVFTDLRFQCVYGSVDRCVHVIG